MFRWIRNFGVFLRKPRGASGRVMHSERAERRSEGGKGGGGGGGGHGGGGGRGGGGHGGGHGGHSGGRGSGHGGGRSSSNYSTGRTLSSSSYSSAGSRVSSNTGKSTRSTSTYTTSKSRDTSNYSTRSTSRNTKSTRSSRPDSSYGSRTASSSKNTRSSNTASTSRNTSNYSTRSSKLTNRSSRSASRTTRNRGRATSRSPAASTASRRSGQRGRDRTRRNNVNAQNTVLSPTNRSSRLDRSHSRGHEERFQKLMSDPNHPVWNEKIPKGTVVIYTDGSYLRREGKSGIGIFMGPNHELNRSQKIRGKIQSSQYAEFVAVQTALENLRNSTIYNRKTPVIVRTDNLNVIRSLRQGYDTNYPEINKQILDTCKNNFKKVDFQHVYAHEGDPGNEMADLLAGMATSKTNLSCGRSRTSSRNRERNRQRSKSNDPSLIRDSSFSIESRNGL